MDTVAQWGADCVKASRARCPRITWR